MSPRHVVISVTSPSAPAPPSCISGSIARQVQEVIEVGDRQNLKSASTAPCELDNQQYHG
eukprot:19515-Heterococcus_DN1.PRE.2